jgi:hypothetical protein
MFLLLACLTTVVSGQTGYYQPRAVQPAPVVYPQTNPVAGWNAGSPTGISTLPQWTPRPTAMSITPAPIMTAPMMTVPMMAAPNMPAPIAAGYTPMVAGQPPANPVYYLPAVAQPATSSYWTEIGPTAGIAPQAQPAATGYFAPTTLTPMTRPNYVPAVGGPALAGPPAQGPYAHGPTLKPEGSVLHRQAPSMHGPQAVVPHSGSATPSGGEHYVEAPTHGIHGVTEGTVLGHGFGKARSGCGKACCASPWFVGFGGLVMSRDNENKYRFSYDSWDESIQLTNAQDANFDWASGFEVRFGRMFNCGQNAVEAVYWGLFPSDGVTTTTAGDVVGNLNGILNWDQLDYGLDPLLLPRTADEFVNNSTMHMVQRHNEIHNIEVNFLTFLGGGYGGGKAPGGAVGSGGACGGGCSSCGRAASAKGNAGFGSNALLAGIGSRHGHGHGGCGAVCGSRWSHDWLVGLRIFSFRDHLLFGAEETGGNGVFGYEDDEIYYDIDITNDLVGLQLGYSGAYAMSHRCSLDYGIKFGMYGNQISHVSEIGGNQGIATINNGPNVGIDFYVENTKKEVSFLGEANLGVAWQFGNCWSAKIGYRAVAVTGIAHPTNQIYHDLRGIQDVEWIGSNGSLVLHGGYASAQYRF